MYNWSPLLEEFRIWRDLGLILPFWWRDDDAIQPTPELDRLTKLSQSLGIPVHLAVIPDHLHPELGPYVRGNSNLRAITHGWTHRNLALPRKKSSEFGANRAPNDVQREIAEGAQIIRKHFGASFIPIFVPPWNRFFHGHASLLAEAGYTALSLFKPRIWQMAAPHVELVNTHVDPIEWRGNRALSPPDQIIAKTVKLLRDRRMGYTDPREPLGYLTHHLDHTEDIWHFSEHFLTVMRDGPTRLATFLPTPTPKEIRS
jgi:hypothetical protein